MDSRDVVFVLLAANPVGGLLFAIPFAVLRLHYPIWLAIALGTPLAYLQVVVVDTAWSALVRIPGWRGFLGRRRSARVERLVASRGAFWITFAVTPFLGPWLVMALMRYAQVGQRRVALPILASLACIATTVALACTLAPRAFMHEWEGRTVNLQAATPGNAASHER
jgi:hypothetical protein